MILRACIMAVLAGFGVGWYIQGLRWDADVAQMRDTQSQDLAAAYADRDEKVELAEKKKEEVNNEYQAFKSAEAARNVAISSGAQRVHVRATCPAVPATQTNTSRTEGGTAELDPAYRQALSDLRAGAAEQLRLLNVCRAELIGR